MIDDGHRILARRAVLAGLTAVFRGQACHSGDRYAGYYQGGLIMTHGDRPRDIARPKVKDYRIAVGYSF